MIDFVNISKLATEIEKDFTKLNGKVLKLHNFGCKINLEIKELTWERKEYPQVLFKATLPVVGEIV